MCYIYYIYEVDGFFLMFNDSIFEGDGVTLQSFAGAPLIVRFTTDKHTGLNFINFTIRMPLGRLYSMIIVWRAKIEY